MTGQNSKSPKGNQSQGKSFLEQRAEATIKRPYKRQSRKSWMEDVQEQLGELVEDVQNTPEAEWEDIQDLEAFRLERAEVQAFGEIRSTPSQRKDYVRRVFSQREESAAESMAGAK